MEKFFDIKCRYSGLVPNVVVLVATVRALKMHGGGPKVVAGKPLDSAYTDENLSAAGRAGQHAGTSRNALRFGIPVVVAVNRFTNDTPAKRSRWCAQAALEAGAEDAVVSTHWAWRRRRGVELAEAVVRAAEKPSNFKFLYPLEFSIKEKIETICRPNLRRGRRRLPARRKPRSNCTPAWASTSCRCAWPRRISA
jgi:methylenetetrahydrofolate dehydrogenase (NADP+) / methenyltetrahydrofolate cyclohydrolase / formyltetrahydrofolate synthetase